MFSEISNMSFAKEISKVLKINCRLITSQVEFSGNRNKRWKQVKVTKKNRFTKGVLNYISYWKRNVGRLLKTYSDRTRCRWKQDRPSGLIFEVGDVNYKGGKMCFRRIIIGIKSNEHEISSRNLCLVQQSLEFS
jgi:hypothetical protein